jgi:hypothetical protein
MRARVRRLAILALGAVSSLACAGERKLVPPPSAPSVDEPALVMPADLDLVVRLDLARLRGLLGGELSSNLESMLRRTTPQEPDASTARLLLTLFNRADTAWIGVRPGLAPELTDSAVVLRGRFSGVVPREIGGAPAFAPPEDLGGGVLRFERSAAPERAAPAVLYLREPDLVVVGSIAEMDALDRTLLERQVDAPLRAPETGLLSASARLALLHQRLSERAPTFAGLLNGAERLELSVDHSNNAFTLKLDVAFDTADRATLVAEALSELARILGRGRRAWLAKTRVEALGRFVSLRLSLTESELASLVGCARDADC